MCAAQAQHRLRLGAGLLDGGGERLGLGGRWLWELLLPCLVGQGRHHCCENAEISAWMGVAVVFPFPTSVACVNW